jgi:hypothetical protein
MQLDPRFVKVAHDPGDPVLCSHCPFCGSGQITGRSDGGIDCAFCGQSFIVRVQPAFPGMPQAPGMGAPTDVGPDMPPGMEGMPPPGMDEGGMPPGMEGGEGMPPGGEGEEEGPPFGDEDEEGGEPGEAEEEEGSPQDEEEGPPPPKKKAAAAAARRYRTLAGDELDEAGYIRHLAIVHSAMSPSVLAQVRREHQAYLTTGDDPHHRAKYDEGYTASENDFTGHEERGEPSPLEAADERGEPDSWYQGYMDHATDRPYGHAVECPAHDHDGPGCTLWDDPERHDPMHVRNRDTAWLSQHRIQGSRQVS